jgi:hypothetical protein
VTSMLNDDEWDHEWSEPDLPTPPDPGEVRIVQLPGDRARLMRYVGIADVDYSAPEPDVGWRGGPTVLWTFRRLTDGTPVDVSPEEVLD